MIPISEENTINAVSEVDQNDTEASCDLWFALLTRIFIGNLLKIVQFKYVRPISNLGTDLGNLVK